MLRVEQRTKTYFNQLKEKQNGALVKSMDCQPVCSEIATLCLSFSPAVPQFHHPVKQEIIKLKFNEFMFHVFGTSVSDSA